jgi:AcrR family transcriptional regulator
VAENSVSLLSLDDERRNLTRNRIRRASMEVVARRGLSATVEEIATLSGVSARTIFRYYQSRDHLMAVTVLDMFEACGLPRSVDEFDHHIGGLPDLVEDVDAWIEGLSVLFHTRSAAIFGLAFWDIHTPRPHASAVLQEVMELRRQYCTRGIGYLAATVWAAAGGSGDPPEDLVMAFAVNLSVFTTQALMIDFNRTPEEIGSLIGRVLTSVLHHAVEAQRLAG